MRPSAHFYSGLIFWFILFVLNLSNLEYDLIFFITPVIILDLDYLGKFIFIEQNHRKYLTHSPTLWFVFLVGTYLIQFKILFWISLGFLFHVIIDIIDWGIFLIPIKNIKQTPHLLKVNKFMKTEKDFSIVYWNNKSILILELTLFLISVFILIFLTIIDTNIFLLIYIIILFLSTTFLSFFEYKTAKIS